MSGGVWGGGTGIRSVQDSQEWGKLSLESCTEVVSHLTINKCLRMWGGETILQSLYLIYREFIQPPGAVKNNGAVHEGGLLTPFKRQHAYNEASIKVLLDR